MPATANSWATTAASRAFREPVRSEPGITRILTTAMPCQYGGRLRGSRGLRHDPEKWALVFPRDKRKRRLRGDHAHSKIAIGVAIHARPGAVRGRSCGRPRPGPAAG